jgi:hypothetical protein
VALRVLHCPQLVGGQASGLARAERELGLESVCVALEPSRFGYEADELASHGRGVWSEISRWQLLLRAITGFDVVHFNFGQTILRPPALSVSTRTLGRSYGRLVGLRDLPVLRGLGKIIAVTFQGDDIRQGDVQRSLYDHSLATAVPENYDAYGDRSKRRIATEFARWSHLTYFLNPDLAHVLPRRARFLPYASVDPRRWVREGHLCGERPLIVHAPSDPRVKGTREIVATLEGLRDEGIEFDFRLVEGMPQHEARRVYSDADIFVDQLNAGWYGAAAVELMALQVPVVCFIREDDLSAVDPAMVRELPVIRTDAGRLKDTLRDLLRKSPEELRRLGVDARAYVERWHDPLAIAARTKSDYESARNSTR